jgi:hypothetical protein
MMEVTMAGKTHAAASSTAAAEMAAMPAGVRIRRSSVRMCTSTGKAVMDMATPRRRKKLPNWRGLGGVQGIIRDVHHPTIDVDGEGGAQAKKGKLDADGRDGQWLPRPQMCECALVGGGGGGGAPCGGKESEDASKWGVLKKGAR